MRTVIRTCLQFSQSTLASKARETAAYGFGFNPKAADFGARHMKGNLPSTRLSSHALRQVQQERCKPLSARMLPQ